MSVANAVATHSPQRLFDTHCHLDLPELAVKQQLHWRQAQHNGVASLLIPAVEPTAWHNLLNLHSQHPNWHIALGIHPWWAAKYDLTALDELATLLKGDSNKICAVGEIGLDFALTSDTFATQRQLFSAQLALAKTHRKPVILHHRKSQPELIAQIKQQRFNGGGILHAFSGSVQQAMAFIEQGFKLGIGGGITYQRAVKTRNTVQKLPLSHFVLETDAPAMPLSGFQGQLNTPAQLALVFNTFCSLRPEPPAEIAIQLWQNSVTALQLGLSQ
jgi:TatD DNase family protein